MALLTYPMTDSIALGLRRLETRALRAALRASTAEEHLRRVRALLDLRAERFERLPSDAAAYERGTELNEGLARYVEGRALEQDDRAVPDTAAFPPEAVRRRAYATGQGLAVLLDRSVPGWKESLASDSTASLDGLLRGAVPTDPDGLSAAGAAGEERERAFARAGRDVRALERQRRERLADFQERPGWTLEIVAAEGAPLRAQRFDPINLMKAGESRVLHTRWLVLGNEDGRVEIMDHWALTTPAGAHPLFEGIRRLTVTGLVETPRVVQEGGIVRIEAPAVEGEIRGRAVERSDRRIVIRM